MKLHQIPGELRWHIQQLLARSYPPIQWGIRAKKRDMVFFYSLPGTFSGSLYLRSHQLSEVFSSLTETFLIDDLDDVRGNSIVIGAKGTLEQLKQAKRKSAGNEALFLYDPVDELISPASLRGSVDGVIASSYNQYNALLMATGTPVYRLLHHVDFRIPRQHQKASSCSIGYFGARGNVFMPSEISQRVDFIDATLPTDHTWFVRLTDYSCHYCVRRKREKSHSYKPSTKLYLAACVGAAVITTRDESDAGFLLPPDYPFFCNSRSAKSVLELIDYVHESFGTAVFERAKNDVAALRGWDFSDQVEQARYLLELVP